MGNYPVALPKISAAEAEQVVAHPISSAASPDCTFEFWVQKIERETTFILFYVLLWSKVVSIRVLPRIQLEIADKADQSQASSTFKFCQTADL